MEMIIIKWGCGFRAWGWFYRYGMDLEWGLGPGKMVFCLGF